MLKKRFIGVITVKDGWAVQSFGYSRYLPLGRPEVLAENLDRWGIDEIIVQCIDRSRQELGPDFDTLRRIGSLGLSTPLTFGGGIASVEHARASIQLGADRICVDSLLWNGQSVVRDIADVVGSQALIGVLPLSIERGELRRKNHIDGMVSRISAKDLLLFKERTISEAMLVDWAHEGVPRGFDSNLLKKFPLEDVPLIVFGGLSHADQMSKLFASRQVSAVAVGNFLAYREHAVQLYRKQLVNQPIRPPLFGSAW